MRPKNYYSVEDVAGHSDINDFWIIIHDNVIDLTSFLNDRRDHWNDNLEKLSQLGGRDLSRFFEKDFSPKIEKIPETGKERCLFPPIVETAYNYTAKTWGKLWSEDPMYRVGKVSHRQRRLRIHNTVTGLSQIIIVCQEDTMGTIIEKYKDRYNSNSGIYSWRKLGSNNQSFELNMNGTLDENGLIEEKSPNIPPPTVWLYLRDDIDKLKNAKYAFLHSNTNLTN